MILRSCGRLHTAWVHTPHTWAGIRVRTITITLGSLSRLEPAQFLPYARQLWIITVFFSLQCRCRLVEKSKSRWHQPRRAVQPGRVVCSRSSFLAPRCHPFSPHRVHGTVLAPAAQGCAPQCDGDRWMRCSRNVVLACFCTRTQVVTTSHRRLATGRNSRLLQEFIWPCSLSIVRSLGVPSPSASPYSPWPPIAKLPWPSPPPLLQPYPNRQPSSLPQDLHSPLHITGEVLGYRGIQQELRETSHLPS